MESDLYVFTVARIYQEGKLQPQYTGLIPKLKYIEDA